MRFTIPERKVTNHFCDVKRGECFIDVGNKTESGEEELYMRTDCVEEADFLFNAVNLENGDDPAEIVRVNLDIIRS